jgi:diaminopimelate decarboxylase
MTQWPVVNDCLVVGGVSLTRLARRVGSTPFYATTGACSPSALDCFAAICQPDQLHYAIKANPMPALVVTSRALWMGWMLSGRELNVALDAGMTRRKSACRAGQSESELAGNAARILINVSRSEKSQCWASCHRHESARARRRRVNPVSSSSLPA